MNTIQLTKIMKSHPSSKKLYLGTFSVDTLPTNIKYPSCLIFNNQRSDQPGQHWVAIYFGANKKAEFFDSFGGSPKDYGIDGYMKKHALSTVYNKQVLQTKLSVYCGLYCLLFLICKCKHRSLKYFLNLFDKPKINDNTFFRLINKYL